MQLLKRKDFKASGSQGGPETKKRKTEEPASSQVRQWLLSQFDEVTNILCEMLEDREPGIQVCLLRIWLIP